MYFVLRAPSVVLHNQSRNDSVSSTFSFLLISWPSVFDFGFMQVGGVCLFSSRAVYLHVYCVV